MPKRQAQLRSRAPPAKFPRTNLITGNQAVRYSAADPFFFGETRPRDAKATVGALGGKTVRVGPDFQF